MDHRLVEHTPIRRDHRGPAQLRLDGDPTKGLDVAGGDKNRPGPAHQLGSLLRTDGAYVLDVIAADVETLGRVLQSALARD